ncbi:hypothetical protein BC830DRAFT_312464 [Chytriomyces sp. MP71]|nr:hypothetical protein BC830DRAFT_312464 [Chytriomyces sp. MP71]
MQCLPRYLVPSLAMGPLLLRIRWPTITCTWCRGGPKLRGVRELSATSSSPRRFPVSPHTKLAISIQKSARKQFAEIVSRLESGSDPAPIDSKGDLDCISLDAIRKPVDVAIALSRILVSSVSWNTPLLQDESTRFASFKNSFTSREHMLMREQQRILCDAFRNVKSRKTGSALALHSTLCERFAKPLIKRPPLREPSYPSKTFTLLPIQIPSPTPLNLDTPSAAIKHHQLSSFELNQQWHLVRCIANLFLRESRPMSALKLVKSSCTAFPLSRLEAIALLVPFVHRVLFGRIGMKYAEKQATLHVIFRLIRLLVTPRTSNPHITVNPSTTSRPNSWLTQLPPKLCTLYTSLLLKTLFDRGQVTTAMELLHTHLNTPTQPLTPGDLAVLYGIASHALCMRGLPGEALALLRAAPGHAVHAHMPEVSNVTPILESLARSGHVSRAFEILYWMGAARLDERALKVVYWGCLRLCGWRRPDAQNRSGFRENKNRVAEAADLFLRGCEGLVKTEVERQEFMNLAHSAMILQHADLRGRDTTLFLFKNALRANVRVTLPVLRAAVALYDPASEPAQALRSEIAQRRREGEDMGGVRKLRVRDFGDFHEEGLEGKEDRTFELGELLGLELVTRDAKLVALHEELMKVSAESRQTKK